MKAAVYRISGPADVLSYEDVADPVPGENQVLIRVEAISIEGGDFISRKLFTPAQTPHIGGMVAAGEIIAVGEKVTGLRAGQKVSSFGDAGSHARLRVAREDHCWVVPDDMDMAKAACAQIAFGTAYLAMFMLGGLTPGQTMLVQGAAGGVGIAAVQLGRRYGMRVIGTASNGEQLARLRDYGLDEGINYKTEDVVARAKALTGGRGVDVVIDPVGGASLQKMIDCLADGGKVILLGIAAMEPNTIDALGLLAGRKSLIGCLLGIMTHEPAIRAAIQHMLDLVYRGELDVVIDRVFPLSEAAAAHFYAETRGRTMGRVVMVP